MPVKRENHLRIFKDQDNINNINYDFYTYDGFKYMIFEDFKNFCKDKLQDNKIIDIYSINFDLFLKESKNVRNLSKISYRLLNFILYSCLHYSFILGLLTEEQIVKFLPPFTTTFQIIEEDWNLLSKALFEKEIQYPQIFLNVITPNLIELINKYENIETIEKRSEFEDKINQLVNDTINNKEQIKRYKENNNLYLGLSLTSMKAILQEILPPDNYDEKEYPYLKYFMLRLSPSEDLLLENIKKLPNYINKYPNKCLSK